MKRISRSVWILPLVLALIAGGCATNDDNEPDPELIVNSLEDDATPAAGTVTLRSAIAAAGSGEVIGFDRVARRRHDRPDGRRRGALGPAGRGLHRQRVFGLQRTGLRQVGPLRPQGRGHRRLGPAARHQVRMGRRRGEPGPGDGRLRKPELVQRDHRVGLFPGGGDRRGDAALHAGPGRRPGGLGDRPAPRLRRRRQHLRRRYRRQPRPRHLRRRHLLQRPRPRGHRRQRQPGPRRRGRGRRHLFRRRGRQRLRPGQRHRPGAVRGHAATG